jgi:hypothetical protein
MGLLVAKERIEERGERMRVREREREVPERAGFRLQQEPRIAFSNHPNIFTHRPPPPQ